MSENIKTWMIEPGDVLDVLPPSGKPLATATVKPTKVSEKRTVAESPKIDPVKRRAKVVPPTRETVHFAPLAIMTYLAGPLAILLTPHRREHRNLMIMAGVAVLAATPLVFGGFRGLVRPEHGNSVWAWLALLAIATVAGFTAWARAVHFLGREGLPPVHRLPHWLRRRWSVGLLGLVAPGSGLLLRGHSGRAALILWLFGPVVAAVVILANTLGLWRHHQQSGWLAASGHALEVTIVVAAALVAVGFLAYVAQALDGARRVIAEPGLQKSARGDYYAVAVLALVVVLTLTVSPVRLASQLDVGSDILRAEGFQAIPLQLSLASKSLDPGEPAYALQVVELYAAMGANREADAVRAELDRSLGTYVAMIRDDAPGANQSVLASPQLDMPKSVPEENVRGDRSRPLLSPTNLFGLLVRDHEDDSRDEPTPRSVSRAAGASRTMGMPGDPAAAQRDSISRAADRTPQ